MPTTRGSLAERAVAALRAEREQTLRVLLPLTDDQCRMRVQSEGREKTVNQVLRAFSSHELDHLQHLVRLLQARGWTFSEAEVLMMKANALLGEFEALVLSLSDEEFLAQGPADGDWNAQQVVDHVLGNEKRYREDILAGVDRNASAA